MAPKSLRGSKATNENIEAETTSSSKPPMKRAMQSAPEEAASVGANPATKKVMKAPDEVKPPMKKTTIGADDNVQTGKETEVIFFNDDEIKEFAARPFVGPEKHPMFSFGENVGKLTTLPALNEGKVTILKLAQVQLACHANLKLFLSRELQQLQSTMKTEIAHVLNEVVSTNYLAMVEEVQKSGSELEKRILQEAPNKIEPSSSSNPKNTQQGAEVCAPKIIEPRNLQSPMLGEQESQEGEIDLTSPKKNKNLIWEKLNERATDVLLDYMTEEKKRKAAAPEQENPLITKKRHELFAKLNPWQRALLADFLSDGAAEACTSRGEEKYEALTDKDWIVVLNFMLAKTKYFYEGDYGEHATQRQNLGAEESYMLSAVLT